MNLRDQNQVVTAILRYNNSMAYTANVLAGGCPRHRRRAANCRPSAGSTPPPISDSHLDV